MNSVQRKVYEQAREIPVIEEADVVVIGGGPGGLPAAVAAARKGCKVVLIERYGVLGGLATTGLMGPFYGFAPQETKGKINRSILGGIPLEIVRRLQKIGGAPEDKDICWRAIRFDPYLLQFVADDIVQEAGVTLLLHSLSVATVTKNEVIDTVIIESKSGRQAVHGKIYIDATGDGDIAYFSGASYEKGRPEDKLDLAMGTRFRIGGVRERTHEEIKRSYEIVGKATDRGEIHCCSTGLVDDCGATVRENEVCPDVTRCRGDGTNVRDLTHAEIKIRKDTFKMLKFVRKKLPGFESSYLMDLPFQIGVRGTRRIVGLYKLSTDDVAKCRKYPETTVARGCIMFDLQCPLGHVPPKAEFSAGVCSQMCKIEPPCIMKIKYKDHLVPTPYLPPDDYYDIPYGCLVSKEMKNLLVSGRCISASHEAQGSLRVVGTCMAIGEAAGISAALCIQKNIRPRDLDIKILQNQLRENDVSL